MQLQQWVPWVLATGNVSSAFIIGAGQVKGWVIMGTTQLILISYALATDQLGLAAQGLVMGMVAAYRTYKWITNGVHRKGSKELKDV